ncbi:ABC transporter ATP-binding protein [Thermocladium modestius]|uniref:ABC transporter ATP-binding protein n=2 Tax=Thermocladium modestius TaxID=62609 RepID=A0A830GSQ6_9CREN|nr:ABC transporter ATP-binding protein [Thermocladium modestius]
MASMFIEARDLWKIYNIDGVESAALRGASIAVERGEFRCIIGPSGSGKTTLLSLIGGLEKPTKGYLRVGNHLLHEMRDPELTRYRNEMLGFVFQMFYLIPRISIVENVELPLVARGVPRHVRREMAIKALEAVGLGNKLHQRINQLSGGEQQRVAIARAIVHEPQLLLADEPTGNLDTENTEKVMDLFMKLNKDEGITIVMVTHNMELTKYCTATSKIRDGKVVETIRETSVT